MSKIQSKQDLKKWIEEDRKACHKSINPTFKERIIEWLFPDWNCEMTKCVRQLEYLTNVKRGGVIWWLKWVWFNRKHSRLQAKTGIEINTNCAGPGLHISHGKIVVSSVAKIGRNCKILSDVTIGGQGRYDMEGAPTIGDRVYIGTGAKIIGNVTIANDCVIGANAVVIKSIDEPGTTWAGNPAKKISDTGSYHYLNK